MGALKPEPKRASENLRGFSRSLPMALLRARETVMERFRPNLRAHNLTDQQWRVLRALYDHGPKNLSELADLCCLLKPSLTRIIRTMVQRGLLEKQADAKDQRRTIVSIAALGQSLIAKVGPNSEEIYQEITAKFGADELEDLYQKLDALMATLAKKERQ